MDSVCISALQVPCRIGCGPEERVLAQTLELDVEIGLRDNRAAGSRQLEDTVCYKTASERIREHAASREWTLLEELAEDLSSLLIESFSAAMAVRIEIKKFIIPGTRFTSIKIARERRATA